MVDPPPEALAPDADSPGRKRVLSGVAGVAVAAVVLWTFRDVHWAALRSQLSAVRPGGVIIAAGLNLTVITVQSLRWFTLVRPLAPAARFLDAWRALFIGLAFSTILPARAGEVARVRHFSRATGVGAASVVGSILLDYLVNGAGLVAFLGFMPLFVDVPLWIRPGALVALVVFLLGLAVAFWMRPAAAAVVPNPLLPFNRVSVLEGTRTGFAAARHAGPISVAVGAALLSWTLEVFVALFAMRAVDLNLPLSAAFMVLLAVNLAVAVPFGPPGNLGTLEVGATLALLQYGVLKEQALAFCVVYHLLQVVPVGSLGLLLASQGSDLPRPV